MQFLFKVIILFCILFNFRVPIFYNSIIVSILLSAGYYQFKKGAIPFTPFFQRFNAVILIATVVLAFVVSLIAVLHNMDIMPTRAKRVWLEFLMLWAIVFVLPLLAEGKESSVFEEVAVIVCSAFALQGLISLMAYLYAPLGSFLMSMKPPEVVADDAASILDNRFRYLNLSGILLVELTAAFGVAFITFFWSQLRSNHENMSGWKKYLIFAFIFVGTTFSGRTGFIGLVMGVAGWLFFSYDKLLMFIKRNIINIIGAYLVFLLVYNVILTGKQRQSLNNDVFPFAFEWYYTHKESGKYEVSSTEAIPQHYFYLYDETLLKGHGIDAYGAHTIYPHSDAGYINNLVYGGIPFLVCLIIYQCLYFARPIAITRTDNSRNNRIDLIFFIILFLYVFIVEIKAPAVGYMYNIEGMYLALGSAYVMQYYTQREQNELIE